MALSQGAACRVIKVGGSACRDPVLAQAMLDWLERQAGTPWVVVCGGGHFADAARGAQQCLGYADAVAHRQALLAMEQTAYWLQAAWQQRHGRRVLLTTRPEPGHIWIPRDLLPGHPAIAEDWHTTSDSLAAWVAGAMGADELWLLKSLPCGRLAWTTEAGAHWTAAGWVDGNFAGHVAALLAAGGQVQLLGQQVWADAMA